MGVILCSWGTLINMAEGRPTWQSSYWMNASVSHLAVDGNDDPNWYAGSFTATSDDITKPPVWAVDLGYLTDIYYVEVVNRDLLPGKFFLNT